MTKVEKKPFSLASWICRCGCGNKEADKNCTKCQKLRQVWDE